MHEYLVKQGYTSPAKLAGTGTSAGGILNSRGITERPDLFRARDLQRRSRQFNASGTKHGAGQAIGPSAPLPIQVNVEPSTKWMGSSTCGKASSTPL